MRRIFSFVLAAALGSASAFATASASGADTAAPSPPPKKHTYTLAECLALADRNNPGLWAARARVDAARAQLDEANWTPFWQFGGSASMTSIANARGAAPYTTATANSLNTSFADGFNPWFRVNLNGAIPLYTFGKIDWIGRAAEANVRQSQWDGEKFRVQTRADVRRAYYGAMLGRDAASAVGDVLVRIDKILALLKGKLERGEVDEASWMRLDIYRDGLELRGGDPQKRRATAMSTLRFLTGVQNDFEIAADPLQPPDMAVAPVVTYLTAARLHRPDTNQARAGIAARRAQLEFAKAKLFPDIALAFFGGYNVAHAADIQNGWVSNPFNSNGFYFGGPLLAIRWSADILPGFARIDVAAAQLEEVRALERLALGGVAVEVENAYGVVLETRRREERYAHAEQITKKWLDKVQDSIDKGTKDAGAITEPLQVYVDQRVNHLYAVMDYDVALSELARVTGWDGAAPPAK